MNRCPSVRTRAKVDRSLSSEARLLWRCSDSVLAWRLGAEARVQLQHPGLAALGALWRPFLQAVVFADRDPYLKVLAARRALELVDSHDFPPPTSAPTGNACAVNPHVRGGRWAEQRTSASLTPMLITPTAIGARLRRTSRA